MSKTILCADDSVTMQKVAEITFRSSDYQYVGARTADDALAKARSENPALILMDNHMPEKNGYDLCRELKADPGLKAIPIIMMCGNSEAYDDAKGREVGCDGHVTKPWDTQKLLDQIGEFIKQGAKPAEAASAPAPTPTPAVPPAAPVPKVPDVPAAAAGLRSPTIMGMPNIQMPPAAAAKGDGASAKPAVPVVAKAPPVVAPAKPAAPVAPLKPERTPVPEFKAELTPVPSLKPERTPVPEPVAPAMEAPTARPPMIKASPTKPIRLVLASQVEQVAAQAAQGLGLDSSQAGAVVELSREVIERVVWEVVPELAEAILRENLDTLTAKQ